MKTRLLLALCLSGALCLAAPPAHEPQNDPRLKSAFRREPQNDWIFVHLEGKPADVGYQHGYLLSAEIEDGFRVVRAGLTHDTKKDWAFFREAAQNVLWPHIEPEYREELQGIVDGLHAKNVQLDVWDIVAYNAWLELGPYYSTWYDRQRHVSSLRMPTPEHCSAFVATGSYTKDGRVVIAHNNWTDYKEGSRWNVDLRHRSLRRPSHPDGWHARPHS